MHGAPRSGLRRRVSAASGSERPLAKAQIGAARSTDPVDASRNPDLDAAGHIDGKQKGSGEYGVGSGDRKASSLSPFPIPHSPFPIPHSPLPFRLLALPEQTTYSGPERSARLGVVHRVFEDCLQVIDRVADGQPLAVGHGLGDDAASATYVFAHRIGQP
jgi:hypothetical protein